MEFRNDIQGLRAVAILAIRDVCSTTDGKFVSAIDRLWPDKKCTTVINNNPVQFDYGHVTYEGAQIILKDLLYA